MVEVFGSTLALLIIIFILINLIVSSDIRAMLERSTEGAKYQVSWQDGSEGLVVISFPDKLRIIETNEQIPRAEICQAGSAFMRYVEKIYTTEKQQLIFAITEGGVGTMALSRNCLLQRWPQHAISIGWIIANRDLLSTVHLQSLPARIKRTIDPP